MPAIRRVIKRDTADGGYIEIVAEERDGSDSLSPGFSITGSYWERGTWNARARAARGRDPELSGAIHEEILAAAPELAPVIAVHLADPNGVPMHAVANGWYLYSGKSREYEERNYGPAYVARQGTDHERAARALHIPPADLPEGLDKAGFIAFADSLRPRWAEQAEAARAILNTLPEED